MAIPFPSFSCFKKKNLSTSSLLSSLPTSHLPSLPPSFLPSFIKNAIRQAQMRQKTGGMQGQACVRVHTQSGVGEGHRIWRLST